MFAVTFRKRLRKLLKAQGLLVYFYTAHREMVGRIGIKSSNRLDYNRSGEDDSQAFSLGIDESMSKAF